MTLRQDKIPNSPLTWRGLSTIGLRSLYSVVMQANGLMQNYKSYIIRHPIYIPSKLPTCYANKYNQNADNADIANAPF